MLLDVLPVNILCGILWLNAYKYSNGTIVKEEILSWRYFWNYWFLRPSGSFACVQKHWYPNRLSRQFFMMELMKISHLSDFYLVSLQSKYVICVQLLAEVVVFTGYSPNAQIELHKMPFCFAVVRVFSSYQIELSEDFLRATNAR